MSCNSKVELGTSRGGLHMTQILRVIPKGQWYCCSEGREAEGTKIIKHSRSGEITKSV